MKLTHISLILVAAALTFTSCKKKGCTNPASANYDPSAEKDDGSCEEVTTPAYTVPTTYSFVDANGNNTVSYSGQTDRLNQLSEMTTLMGTGTTAAVSAQDLKDMYANVGDNGNGNFSFTSTKQLKNKTFTLDQTLFESWMDDFATASQSFGQTASDGQAGTLTSISGSTYLFDANGVEHKQYIEKGLMGAVFLYQALNVYFGDGKMDVDNTTAEDPTNGKYYTAMEHHWDEAFGYFGVDTDFPTTIPTRFWGKYCNSQDPTLNCNDDMMTQFLTGRAAITANELGDRDAAIAAIRTEWEEISANQAMTYLDDCVGYFGSDQAKFLHALSEAYAFAWNLRYAPTETRRMTTTEHDALMQLFPTNFWNVTVSDLNNIKNAINAKY
ncbi:MAG: DUF4856 domain-containing protein [Crocinitomicaceae bacterium]